MIKIENINFRYGASTVFENATVNINSGLKIGLVGKNGSGKSTLFKLILGELYVDEGFIETKDNLFISHVKQDVPEGNISIIDCVLNSDIERTNLLNALEKNPSPEKISEIHERLNAINAHSAPARASSILNGLGFPSDIHQNPVNSLSGGWKMRISLASALFKHSDLMLLDEPTNHLDFEAVMWLENYLASYTGTLLIISHDRELLNKVTKNIIHIENKKLSFYGGNYDSFEKNLREKKELQAKAYEKQQLQKKHIQKFIDRFRYKATKAKQAQSRIKMLEKMENLDPIIDEKSINFSFPQVEQLAPPIIHIENGFAGYGDKTVLKNINLRIDMDDRIALLGANGNGKSTLAKIISERLELKSGSYKKNKKLNIGYFAQEQLEELNPEDTPFQHLQRLMPNKLNTQIRSHLGRFGFSSDLADNKVNTLSGGEKARLLLALITYAKPELIILDEPTNHLDIDSRQSLMKAINEFEGAVILITHDMFLINHTADRLYLVENNNVKRFDGDIEDYKNHLISKSKIEKESKKANIEDTNTSNKKLERKKSAENRAKQAPIKKEISKIEQQLNKLEKEKNEIEDLMGNPQLYEKTPKEKIMALQLRLAEIQKNISDNEFVWLELNEKLET